MFGSEQLKNLIEGFGLRPQDSPAQSELVKTLTHDIQMLESQNTYLIGELDRWRKSSEEHSTRVKKLESRLSTLRGYFKDCLDSCPSEEEQTGRKLQTLVALANPDQEETWTLGEGSGKSNYDFLRTSGDMWNRNTESQKTSHGFRVNLDLPISSMLRELNSNLDTSGLDRSSSGTTSTLHNAKPKLDRLTRITAGLKRKCEKFLKTFEDVENADKLIELRRLEAERAVRQAAVEQREDAKNPPVLRGSGGMKLDLDRVGQLRNSNPKIDEEVAPTSERAQMSTSRRLNIKDILGPYSSRVVRSTRPPGKLVESILL